MSRRFTLTVSPGKPITQSLNQGIQAGTVDIWNSSPFDLDYAGFGVAGTDIVAAGTAKRFHAEINNTGHVDITPNNNAGVSGNGTVIIQVFDANERVPPGTFPVSIPTQTVMAAVSGVQTLTNETSTLGAEIIDIGQGTNVKMLDIFNDHFVWSVIQSGVAHQVLKGQASGTPLLIGQSGDQTQIVGGAGFGSGHSRFNENGNLVLGIGNVYLIEDSGASAKTFAYMDGSNDFRVLTSSANGKLHLRNSADNADLVTFHDVTPQVEVLNDLTVDHNLVVNNTIVATGFNVDGAGNIIENNNLGVYFKDSGATARKILTVDTSNNTVLNAPASGAKTLLNDNAGSNQIAINNVSPQVEVLNDLRVDGDLKLLIGSLSRIAIAGPYTTTTTPTAFNHNLGVVPDIVIPVITGTGNASVHQVYTDFPTATTTQVTMRSDSTLTNLVYILSIKM